jgi:tRNA dimethylallyltransferase
MKKLVILVGPTGSGKTGLSIQLAKHFGFEIINGDSVQVYQGLDIGSAKIKPEEMEGISHHLLSFRDPRQPYSVFNFQHDARHLIETLDKPMIVGGTGFYINAAISNYEFVEEKRHEEFDRSRDHVSNMELYDQLIKHDPEIIIDYHNRRRLLRALEQALSGNLRSQKNKKDEKIYQPLIIYLDLNKDVLVERLWNRLEKQLKDGFVEEVKQLLLEGISIHAIGYREIEQYIKGLLTEAEMKEAIIKASKVLAKKQKTYFINQMHPVILDACSKTLVEDAKNLIASYLGE